MIGSLRGTVLERTGDGEVLLEVGGVGYRVLVSPRVLGELEPTSTAFLYVHHHIREDAELLYGFLSRDERLTFEMLLKANGVGPALAGGCTAARTRHRVTPPQSLAALSRLPGDSLTSRIVR